MIDEKIKSILSLVGFIEKSSCLNYIKFEYSTYKFEIYFDEMCMWKYRLYNFANEATMNTHLEEDVIFEFKLEFGKLIRQMKIKKLLENDSREHS